MILPLPAVLQSLGLSEPVAGIIAFWIYDSVKILTLMAGLFFLLNYVRTYLTPQRISRSLERHRVFQYPLASFFGTLSPFCSCSTIPLFLGFLRAGVSIGPTLTFLLTSPIVNLVAIPILLTAFGWKITLLYTATGLSISMIAGFSLEKLGFEKDIDRGDTVEQDIENRWNKAYRDTYDQMKRFTPYVLAGTALGAVIQGYLPTTFLKKYANTFWAIPLAVLLAVPVYTNIFAVIPVVASLMAKGLPVSVALTFMMAAAGLSLPEFVMLKEVMDNRMLATLIGVVTAAITLTGYMIATIPGL
ncbi:MAG: permease [Candidatus Nanohaloarchaea archaeon]|nr:permease [Candidatus Nanohaloarchaea archaeon]